MSNEMVLEGGYGSKTIPVFTLNANSIGSSSTTINVSNAKMIAFDAETTIQINAVGETFTVLAGSRWGIAPSVTSIALGSATKYILS